MARFFKRGALIALICAVTVECSMRAALAYRLRDPRLFFYAFPATNPISSIYPDRPMPGYRKYLPNPRRLIYVKNAGANHMYPYDASINKNGFRGKDFDLEKKPGVTRIVCLGESSTFGAFDRDEETYPYLLEARLNGDAGRKYEVLNLGVSESNTEWLRNMLVPEILSLNPDIVTYYGGHNDIRDFVSSYRTGRPEHRSLFLSGDVFRVAYFYLPAGVRRAFSRDRVPPRDLPSAAYSEIGPKFKTNLLYLAERFKERGISFIVITQKVVGTDREMKNKSYEAYSAAIKSRGSRSSFSARIAHGHYPLMRGIAAYAKGNFILVDGIGALDGHEKCFMSHVHMSAECNAVLADSIKPAILRARSSVR